MAREFNRGPNEFTLEELVLGQNEPLHVCLGGFPFFYLVHERRWDDLLAHLGIEWTGRRPHHVIFEGVEFFKCHPILAPEVVRDCWVIELPTLNLEHYRGPRPSFFVDGRDVGNVGDRITTWE